MATAVVGSGDEERNRRLQDMMTFDLGVSRREHITTVDKPDAFSVVGKRQIEMQRERTQRESGVQQIVEANKEKLSAWANAFQVVEPDAEAELYDTMMDGQSHRAKLNVSMQEAGGQKYVGRDDNSSGRDVASSNRGGFAGRGGRGGGIAGARGRGLSLRANQIASNARASSNLPTLPSTAPQLVRGSRPLDPAVDPDREYTYKPTKARKKNNDGGRLSQSTSPAPRGAPLGPRGNRPLQANAQPPSRPTQRLRRPAVAEQKFDHLLSHSSDFMAAIPSIFQSKPQSSSSAEKSSTASDAEKPSSTKATIAPFSRPPRSNVSASNLKAGSSLNASVVAPSNASASAVPYLPASRAASPVAPSLLYTEPSESAQQTQAQSRDTEAAQSNGAANNLLLDFSDADNASFGAPSASGAGTAFSDWQTEMSGGISQANDLLGLEFSQVQRQLSTPFKKEVDEATTAGILKDLDKVDQMSESSDSQEIAELARAFAALKFGSTEPVEEYMKKQKARLERERQEKKLAKARQVAPTLSTVAEDRTETNIEVEIDGVKSTAVDSSNNPEIEAVQRPGYITNALSGGLQASIWAAGKIRSRPSRFKTGSDISMPTVAIRLSSEVLARASAATSPAKSQPAKSVTTRISMQYDQVASSEKKTETHTTNAVRYQQNHNANKSESSSTEATPKKPVSKAPVRVAPQTKEPLVDQIIQKANHGVEQARSKTSSTPSEPEPTRYSINELLARRYSTTLQNWGNFLETQAQTQSQTPTQTPTPTPTQKHRAREESIAATKRIIENGIAQPKATPKKAAYGASDVIRQGQALVQYGKDVVPSTPSFGPFDTPSPVSSAPGAKMVSSSDWQSTSSGGARSRPPPIHSALTASKSETGSSSIARPRFGPASDVLNILTGAAAAQYAANLVATSNFKAALPTPPVATTTAKLRNGTPSAAATNLRALSSPPVPMEGVKITSGNAASNKPKLVARDQNPFASFGSRGTITASRWADPAPAEPQIQSAPVDKPPNPMAVSSGTSGPLSPRSTNHRGSIEKKMKLISTENSLHASKWASGYVESAYDAKI